MERNRIINLLSLSLLCAVLAFAPAYADDAPTVQPTGGQAKDSSKDADIAASAKSENGSSEEDKSDSRRKELRKASKQREQRQHNSHKA